MVMGLECLGLRRAWVDGRAGCRRVRVLRLAPLADCRRQFASHLGAPDLEWEAESQPDSQSPEDQSQEVPEDMSDCDDACLDLPDGEWEPAD